MVICIVYSRSSNISLLFCEIDLKYVIVMHFVDLKNIMGVNQKSETFTFLWQGFNIKYKNPY